MLAPENVEMGAEMHPFSPVILISSLARYYTFVTLGP
jgi:hypothetical protein